MQPWTNTVLAVAANVSPLVLLHLSACIRFQDKSGMEAAAAQALPCPMALRAEPALNQVIWLSLKVWFTRNS